MANLISFEIRTITRPGCVPAAWIFGSECEGRLYLGSERLATDPDDRDITGALRLFNLPTAVAPGEWPERWETVRPAGAVGPFDAEEGVCRYCQRGNDVCTCD